MSELRPSRQPRSAARRAKVRAQIGGMAPLQPMVPPQPASQENASPMVEAHPTYALPGPWEDTNTNPTLDLPAQKTFFGRQPPFFWVIATALLIALFSVTLFTGINAWRAYEARRAEERRLRELAEEKAKYKYPHREWIEDYAWKQGIDPALVAAVIYHESRFDPNAVSSVGARGLMQIMKDTGDWIAYRLGELGSYTQDSLFDAETNIRYGTWFLGYLSRMFEGDIIKMAAGYHAGQYEVLRWLKNPDYSPDGYSLDVIPFPSTAQYVNRVVNAYEIYLKHYYPADETPSPGGGAP